MSYKGRVQGVGFRVTCRHLAGAADITGWVRNEPDGSVTLEAQGDPDELERYCTSVRDAMGVRIQSESREACPTEPGESGFEIRR